MCLMKDTKGNLFLDSKTIKEYRQRGVVSRKIILCYILAFLRWTSIGLPPGQKCSRWVRRHNGISLSPARLLRKVYQPLGVASIPFKKFFFSFTRGQMTQEINNTKLVYNDKVYCINRLPPEGLLGYWHKSTADQCGAASIPCWNKKRIAGLLIESCGQLGKSQPIHVQWIRRPEYNNRE